MSNNLNDYRYGDTPPFPVEKEIWDQLLSSTKSIAVDVALTWLGADLEEEARRLLKSRQQEDIHDACQEGWTRFLTKLDHGELDWQGPGTIYRELCRCISSGIRKEGRRREIPIQSVAPSHQAENVPHKRSRRVQLIPFPTTDNPGDNPVLEDWFLYQHDLFSRLDDHLEMYKKYQFIIEMTSQTLDDLGSHLDQNMCILWFFMKMSPQDIQRTWASEINQGRLRRAKIDFVDGNLKLLNEERARYTSRGLPEWLKYQSQRYDPSFIEEMERLCQAPGLPMFDFKPQCDEEATKDEAWVAFIQQLTMLFLHFRAGDKSDKDLNQNHPIVGLLHSLVPPGYSHKPRASSAVATFIRHYNSVKPCDW